MKPREIEAAFTAEGGSLVDGYPVIDAPIYGAPQGTLYLKDPGVVVIGRTESSASPLTGFLSGFPPDLEFPGYLGDLDAWEVFDETQEDGGGEFLPDPSYLAQDLPEMTRLVKIAGQLCYLSFGRERTRNREAARYIHNIVSQGHGSVLEHPNVSVLFYGISRSLTHELVRHRAGCGYSQVSQRYVDGSRLRFVERPEYQNDPDLHRQFETEIDRQAGLYEDLGNRLLSLQGGGEGMLAGGTKRDRRKKVNQAARSVLGNHAEAPIIVTGNLRAWRWVVAMRTSEFAEVEIRRAAYRAFLCLAMLDPIVFRDFTIVAHADGITGVTTPFPKV